MQIELVANVLAMFVDGSHAQMEAFGDLFAGKLVSNELEDAALGWGEGFHLRFVQQ
jgi:hypothetical protein